MHTSTNRTRIVLAASAAALALGMAGCTPDTGDGHEGHDVEATTAAPQQQGSSGPGPEADLASTDMPVSMQDAQAAAQQHLPDGQVTKIELDHDQRAGVWVWKFDLEAGTVQHEVKVSAVDGSVMQDEQDTEDSPSKPVDPTKLTPADAMAAATSLAPGTVSEWALEWDDGVQRYQIEVTDKGKTQDVVVDVDTGAARLDD